jgi:hypothetical protein
LTVAVADSVCTSGYVAASANLMLARISALAGNAAADQAGRELLESRAVVRLEKARESGYFRRPGHIDRVEADPVLWHHCDRADFQEFRGRIRD